MAFSRPINDTLHHSTILCGRASLTLAMLASALLASQPAHALPDPSQVNTTPGTTNIATPLGGGGTAGNVTYTINSANGSAIIAQDSQRAVIDWNHYDTAPGEIVQANFAQANSIQLNRIAGGAGGNGATLFQGKLLSPNGGGQGGTIFLVNQNGFVVNGATINVNGGLIFSTRGIQNAEGNGFYTAPNDANGNLNLAFNQGGAVPARVQFINSDVRSGPAGQGKYIIAQGQGVTLDNTYMSVRNNSLVLGAGETFGVTIDPVGDGLISYQVTNPVTAANLASAVATPAIDISNGSTLVAHGTFDTTNPAGGNILLTVSALDSIYDNLIRINGGSGVTMLDTRGAGTFGGSINVNAVLSGSAPGASRLNGSAVEFNGGGSQVWAFTRSADNRAGQLNIRADVNNTDFTQPLVSLDSQTLFDASSQTGASQDNLINILARGNGADRNDSVFVDGQNIFTVATDFAETVSGRRYFQIQTARGTSIVPCALVNGAATCSPAAAASGGAVGVPSTGAGAAPAGILTVNASPLTQIQADQFDPLDRPVLSLRDQETLDQSFTYADPFFINRGSLNLSVLGSGTAAASTGVAPANVSAALSPTQLGNLAPAAGGDAPPSNATAEQLASLSPAAGGPGSAAGCFNAILDNGWTKPTGEAQNCTQPVPAFIAAQ